MPFKTFIFLTTHLGSTKSFTSGSPVNLWITISGLKFCNCSQTIEIYSSCVNSLNFSFKYNFSSFVFFNPTYEDNYPTVNLEAQACGIPVITYDTGGCRETLYTKNSFCIKKDVYEVIKILEAINGET